MNTNQGSTTTTIAVFTRHKADCDHRDDRYYRGKGCACRKSLYIYENGTVTYKSAKTRSWEEAEKVAQDERDFRSPVKQELLKIAEKEAAKVAAEETAEAARLEAEAAKAVPLGVALDQWTAGLKAQSGPTQEIYQTFKKKLVQWADSQKIVSIRDITPAILDQWRGAWSPEADEWFNKMGVNTQGMFLTRLKSFFSWAADVQFLPRDPSHALKSIAHEDTVTLPLSPEQFTELIQATYAFDAARRRDMDRSGAEMRAIFQMQRWTGMRLSDVLTLARRNIQGNRLSIVTQKTKAKMDRILPAAVVAAFQALPPRPKVHPDYYFWSTKCTYRVLATMWAARIAPINEHLSFRDDKGQELRFHSHMLRDTYAVELLLDGMPLEKVSRLLTHKSIRTTERHYAPWVRRRDEQLEEETIAAMRRQGATFST